MNTIPSGFDENQISRTVFGGIENYADDSLNISVILLNKNGNYFKQSNFENLLGCNFRSIISVESNPDNFSIDEISKKYPAVKFIIPQEEATDGELINLAMSEISSEYVLVLRDSLYIPSGIILTNLAERLKNECVFCLVPRLFDVQKNGIFCQFSPTIEKNKFVVESSSVAMDGVKTLYPFDNIAFYNREKFIQLGGFDYTIKSKYWQNLDFGLRAWLWGEEIKLTTLFKFNYLTEYPVEDKTANLDYLRYYLKNEVPKMKLDQGIIKRVDFFKFYKNSGCGLLEARKQFLEARNWVYKNRYKFKMSLEALIQEWRKEQ